MVNTYDVDNLRTQLSDLENDLSSMQWGGCATHEVTKDAIKVVLKVVEGASELLQAVQQHAQEINRMAGILEGSMDGAVQAMQTRITNLETKEVRIQ